MKDLNCDFAPEEGECPEGSGCDLCDRRRKALASLQAEPVELKGVAEVVADGEGWWQTCSGCLERTYQGEHSDVFGCWLGPGCSECGGIGAVWMYEREAQPAKVPESAMQLIRELRDALQNAAAQPVCCENAVDTGDGRECGCAAVTTESCHYCHGTELKPSECPVCRGKGEGGSEE